MTLGKRPSPEEEARSGVVIGADGWLFWRGRRGRMMQAHLPGPLAPWLTFRWAAILRRRGRRCAALGARFVQVFAPDKLSLYPDKLVGLPLRDGPALRLHRAEPGIVVDLVRPLREGRAGGETVLKTDNHWSWRGYLIAYRELCAALGAPVADTVLEAQAQPVAHIAMDLGGKLDPPVLEPFVDHRIEARARRIDANSLVRAREAQRLTGFAPGALRGVRYVLRNAWGGADPRRVVLFGDSYAFDNGLAGLLAESFREVHFLWSADLDWGYIARVRPDIVLCETAERFLVRPARDGIDLEAFADARARGLAAADRADA